jgi:hypothetical protein
MASASKSGRPSETQTRRRALLQGAFPVFIDPNRPLSHRLTPDCDTVGIKLPASNAVKPSQVLRLTWDTPSCTPHRYLSVVDESGRIVDSSLMMKSYLDRFRSERLVEILSGASYVSTLEEARRLLRGGIRIEQWTGVDKGSRTGCGCWIPVDGQLANNRYRDTFAALYGLRPRTTGECRLHDGRDEPGEGEPNPARYTELIGKDLVLDLSHLCHNPLCVRPDHVVLELKVVNTRRKECAGLVNEAGHCACMTQFVRNFFSRDIDSVDFKRGISLVSHCLRKPSDVKGVQRTCDAAGKITIKEYNSFGFMTAQLLHGPWQGQVIGPGDLCQPVANAVELCTHAVGELQASGWRFLTCPYVFVDTSPVDNWVIKYAMAQGKTGEARLSIGGGAGGALKVKDWWTSVQQACMRRVAVRFEKLQQIRSEAAAAYASRHLVIDADSMAVAVVDEQDQGERDDVDLFRDQASQDNLPNADDVCHLDRCTKKKRRSQQDTAAAAAAGAAEAGSGGRMLKAASPKGKLPKKQKK